MIKCIIMKDGIVFVLKTYSTNFAMHGQGLESLPTRLQIFIQEAFFVTHHYRQDKNFIFPNTQITITTYIGIA